MMLTVIREQRALKKDIKKLNEYELDYDALERIVTKVSGSLTPIEVEITFKNDTKMTVRKQTEQNNFKSFRQRYEENKI